MEATQQTAADFAAERDNSFGKAHRRWTSSNLPRLHPVLSARNEEEGEEIVVEENYITPPGEEEAPAHIVDATPTEPETGGGGFFGTTFIIALAALAVALCVAGRQHMKKNSITNFAIPSSSVAIT